MLSSAPSFTVLTSSTVKDETIRPSSPKRTITSSSTSINNISNKRLASASKSPAATSTNITKKKRLTMTNNIQSISPTIRHTSTMETTTGQNRRTSSIDDMIFFEKVKFNIFVI
jgi:hypothetical protein